MNSRGYHPSIRFPTKDHCEAQRPPEREPTGSFSTNFQQFCPTCGRKLLVDVRHLGRRVYCTHCRCAFVACGEGHGRRYAGQGDALSPLERADQLLALLKAAPRHQPYNA